MGREVGGRGFAFGLAWDLVYTELVSVVDGDSELMRRGKEEEKGKRERGKKENKQNCNFVNWEVLACRV